jgi:hypothetical protein
MVMRRKVISIILLETVGALVGGRMVILELLIMILMEKGFVVFKCLPHILFLSDLL